MLEELADEFVVGFVQIGVRVAVDRPPLPSCPNCGYRASSPMVRQMDVCHCDYSHNPRNLATLALLLLLVADKDLADSSSVPNRLRRVKRKHNKNRQI